MIREWWRRMFRLNGEIDRARQVRKDAERRLDKAVQRRPRAERAASNLASLVQQAMRGGT
jgi:hypothetical protein